MLDKYFPSPRRCAHCKQPLRDRSVPVHNLESRLRQAAREFIEEAGIGE